ncbi:hypothetical protein BU15DRAFT_64930 [Melanogaster broomeanus]|nr:hypothetical protein BU15DRAFT_64930 [Melanogaster broomeanus]
MSRCIDWRGQLNGEEVRGPYNRLGVPLALNNSWTSRNGLSNTAVWGSEASPAFARRLVQRPFHSTPLPTETESEFLWRAYIQITHAIVFGGHTCPRHNSRICDSSHRHGIKGPHGVRVWIQHPDTNYNSTIIPSLMQGPNLLSAPPHPPPQSPPPTPDDISSPSTTSSGSQDYQCCGSQKGVTHR